MNHSWSYMYSPSRSPLPPSSPPDSSGSSQCTRPEHLSHASHLGWWSLYFTFLYSLWSSRDRYTGVVCHSLLQWIISYQKSPPWPVCLGLYGMAHSCIELHKPLQHDKAVIHEGYMNSSKLWEMVRDRETWHSAVHGIARVGHYLATVQQQQQLNSYCGFYDTPLAW